MIDTFFNILRRVMVGTITLVFAFVLLYTPQNFNEQPTVPSAEALIGGIVSDPAHTTISSIGYGIQGGLVVKETILDGIAWAIAKGIVSQMVAATVDWINNGFEGSPAFITDLDQFLLEAVDIAASEFIVDKLGGDDSFLCSPFKLDIQIALALQYENIRAERPYEGCTLSDAFENFEDFIAGDFSQGGWKDWLTLTSEPAKYTPYGAKLAAEQELAKELARTEAKENTQLNWADGFKSNKVCEGVATPGGGTSLKCAIVTPGKQISESLSKSLGAGQDTLITADEISEVIGALIAQLANKAITGAAGLLGLSANTGYTYDGYDGGSYLSAATSQGADTSFVKGLAQIKDSLKVQQDYLALANSTVPILQAYIANPNNPNDRKQVVQTYLRDAQEVQQKAPGYIASLQSLVASYETLLAEYNNPNTTAVRKSEIQQSLLYLMDQYTNTTFYSKILFEGSKVSWNVANF